PKTGITEKVVSLIDILPTLADRLGFKLKDPENYFYYYGKDILDFNNIDSERGVIADKPDRDRNGTVKSLGDISYITREKMIFLEKTETNIRFFTLKNNIQVETNDREGFKKELNDFNKYLFDIKKENSGHSAKKYSDDYKELTDDQIRQLRSMGYLQ
ncbi:hypothetical protein ACFLTD_05325, partial [Elusimicrobiota bacterium]